jgi:hypothetical protein
MKRNPLSRRARLWYTTKIVLWAGLWGFPFGAIGIGLLATIIGIPFGIIALILAAYPLSRMVQRRGEKVDKWKASPTPGRTMSEVDELIWESEMTDTPWGES